jgi:hypothetical protein
MNEPKSLYQLLTEDCTQCSREMDEAEKKVNGLEESLRQAKQFYEFAKIRYKKASEALIDYRKTMN